MIVLVIFGWSVHGGVPPCGYLCNLRMISDVYNSLRSLLATPLLRTTQ